MLLGAGTSAGRDDDTAAAINQLGEVLYHGIAIKPGKPAVLGRIGEKAVMGIPGYPVSGILVLEHIFRPVIDSWLHRSVKEETVEVKLGRRLNSSLKYREFVRATLSVDAQGELVAVPLNRGAGVVTSFVKADCILDIDQDAEGVEAGGKTRARLLRDRKALEQRVAIVGSHDPLIDEAIDLLRRVRTDISLSSSHVGSMGGIMAVKSGQAHMGGVHLLDEATGIYNNAYIDKYFPEGGVALVECVQRTQGLMVTAGNPKNIRGFEDIARSDISYVNRQKGSGTRILCDFQLKQLGMDASSVYGYEREEFTHTGVAAQIAGGTADCGLGILSAARIYGLDFIPVCDEQYDLLIARSALELPSVQAFLEVLGSPAFKERLLALGGYGVDQPGRIRKVW